MKVERAFHESHCYYTATSMNRDIESCSKRVPGFSSRQTIFVCNVTLSVFSSAIYPCCT